MVQNLKSLVVRLITPDEQDKWNELMTAHHYLGFRSLVGESLKYVALLDGQWVALLGWGTAAFQCKARDKWIGWSREQQWKRLSFIANNQRFLILPGVRIPHLASKVLAMNLKRISADWAKIHRHPLLLAETFVDHSRFSGTCYRAANWILLGQTRGYARKAGRYVLHGQPKTVLVYPLHRKAQQLLSAPFLAPELTGGRKAMIDLNQMPIEQENGLLAVLATLKDPRKRRGIRHSQVSVLTVAACAVLAGCSSYVAIGQWAADLSQELLKRLGCKYHEDRKQFIAPSEPTIRRTLQSVDADEMDQAIGQWLFSQSKGNAIAVDGKTLCGSGSENQKSMHLFAALVHKDITVVAQRQVDRKSNEITSFRPLLEPLDLEGKVVTADAMHTQVAHANFLKEEKQADFLFTVKGNQDTLFQDLRDIAEGDFSPCLHPTRKGTR